MPWSDRLWKEHGCTALPRPSAGHFFDGDKFHPQANVEKMAAGKPLTDADRLPWLERLHKLIAKKQAKGLSLVLACSALKENLRWILCGDLAVQFVCLNAPY